MAGLLKAILLEEASQDFRPVEGSCSSIQASVLCRALSPSYPVKFTAGCSSASSLVHQRHGDRKIMLPYVNPASSGNVFVVLPLHCDKPWPFEGLSCFAEDMTELDTLLTNLAAENLALRSLLTGLLIEMIRRGNVGAVSNAFAYSGASLEGLMRKTRPSGEVRERAAELISELRDELFGWEKDEATNAEE